MREIGIEFQALAVTKGGDKDKEEDTKDEIRDSAQRGTGGPDERYTMRQTVANNNLKMSVVQKNRNSILGGKKVDLFAFMMKGGNQDDRDTLFGGPGMTMGGKTIGQKQSVVALVMRIVKAKEMGT